jgi:hypothetical protein
MDRPPKLRVGDLLLGACDSPEELDPKALLLVDVLEDAMTSRYSCSDLNNSE